MRSVGAEYENKSAAYLESLGYKILDRNFCIRGGEVDIVAKDGMETVFVEVKFRKSETFGTPLDAVSPAKIRRLVKTALFYMKKNGMKIENVRFDVVGVTEVSGKTEFSLVKNAFPAEGYYV